MTFWESISTCFRKYTDSSGRASRSEYWWFFLFQGLVVMTAALLVFGLSTMGHGALGMVLGMLLWGPVVPAATAVMTRRLHDTGRSGWFLTASAAVEPGVPWPNEYGPPPGEEEPVEQPSATPVPAAPWWATPTPDAPAIPAVFTSCPGCGKVINREVDLCPYCRMPLGPNS